MVQSLGQNTRLDLWHFADFHAPCPFCFFCLQGIEHLIKSCEFHGTNNDRKNEAAGYTNLGLIYMYKQDFAKALEYYNKALEVLVHLYVKN